MKDIFIVVGMLAVWFALQMWILPRFGVNTRLSGACAVDPQKSKISTTESTEPADMAESNFGTDHE